MEPKITTLSNGLRVVTVDTEVFPTVTTLLLVGAGSRYENKANNGIAHFFEHMAFKGSKKYPNSFIISSTIEGEGGVFNAFTAKDHTGYWIKGLSEDFTTIIDVLSDMVLHPLLLEEEINREKGVIIEEINMYEDTPYRSIGEDFDTLLYPENPLGYEIAGSKETVNSFTRDTFTHYIDHYYHPRNAILAVAGGLKDIKNLMPQIEERFGGWQNGKKSSFEPVVEHQMKPQILLKYKKTEQAHYCLGFRTFNYEDPRRYALSVLSTVLGGGMSSRLFIEVRERRGLCYYISSGRELYADVGNFVTQAGITNNIDKVKDSINVILKEHKKIGQGDVTEDEIHKAKELLKGRLLLSMEDSSNIASFYGNKLLLENDTMRPEEVIAEIEKVRREDVVDLAKTIFVPQTLNLALIGPFRKSQLTVNDLDF